MDRTENRFRTIIRQITDARREPFVGTICFCCRHNKIALTFRVITDKYGRSYLLIHIYVCTFIPAYLRARYSDVISVLSIGYGRYDIERSQQAFRLSAKETWRTPYTHTHTRIRYDIHDIDDLIKPFSKYSPRDRLTNTIDLYEKSFPYR